MRMRAVSLVLALLYAAAPAAIAASAEEARGWIKRMNDAVINRNYDGVLEHYWRSGHETLHIIHRMKDNHMSERVIFSGSRNEIVRNGSQYVEYDRRRGILKAQTLTRSYGYISAFIGVSAESDKVYRISNAGTQRLKDYGQVQLITVEPRDEKRYGYRFWLDKQSAMPIRTQLLAPDGTLLDEITFVTLSLPDTIDDEKLEPALDRKYQWMRPEDNRLPVKLKFVARANLLPEGFRMLNLPLETNADASGPRTRFIVSDGIAWVSVFVSVADKPQFTGLKQASASGTYMFVTNVDGHYITAVGEVPPATVQRIAEAVRPE